MLYTISGGGAGPHELRVHAAQPVEVLGREPGVALARVLLDYIILVILIVFHSISYDFAPLSPLRSLSPLAPTPHRSLS